MKISGHNIIRTLEGPLSGAVETQPHSANNRVGLKTDATNDPIELSHNAIEFNRIKNVIKDIPEIRTKRVEELADQIRGGQYNVSADLIEPKLVKEHMTDALLTT